MPRKSKPKTQTQLDNETNNRLLRTYGITLAEYEEQLRRQLGGCAICHRPPANLRLHTDHDHALQRLRIDSWKDNGIWHSRLRSDQWAVGETTGRTKSKSLQALRLILKRRSVRGLLCAQHNRGLRFFGDDPKLLRAAADYLEVHQNVGWIQQLSETT